MDAIRITNIYEYHKQLQAELFISALQRVFKNVEIDGNNIKLSEAFNKPNYCNVSYNLIIPIDNLLSESIVWFYEYFPNKKQKGKCSKRETLLDDILYVYEYLDFDKDYISSINFPKVNEQEQTEELFKITVPKTYYLGLSNQGGKKEKLKGIGYDKLGIDLFIY